MDDLDHSIHIAEYDWTCFCEESEECSLLKPSLACPDSSGLSDSEDSEISDPVQLNKSRTGEDEKSLMQLDSDVCSVCSAGNILNTAEVHAKAAEETRATDNSTGLSDKLDKDVRRLETEVDSSRNEPDPSFFAQTKVKGNEPHATEAALSRVNAGAEEARWFLTVSDRPARQQAAASSVRTKTRQKPPGKNRSSKQEKCVEMIKDDNDSEGGRDTRGFVQLKQTLVPKSGDAPSAKANHELQQMCCKNEKMLEMSEMLLITNSLTEHIAEPTIGRTTHVSRNVSDLEGPSQVETPEPDELDLRSILSLPAAESADEPLYTHQDRVTENQQLLLLATSPSPNANHAQDRGLNYCDGSLSCNAPATKCDGYEGSGAEPTPAFPSADQRADNMPDDNSTCDEDTRSTELCVFSDSPTRQNQEIHLSASGGSSGRQLSPDLNITPCSVTSSSEEAAGLTGPVYAISAFWNEMEKLTINDILRLRMARSTPHTQTQDKVTPGAHGFPVSHTCPADGVECNSPDVPTDTSDIADSDYFTQPDESKPDCSSCEFSTSDLEEEYWHFIGASRNPSPDAQDKNHPRTSGSPLLSHGELWCTWPPVRSEDCAGQHLDHHGSHALMKASWLGEMIKSTTEQSVQALNTEELTSQSSSGDDESSLFLSHSPALEDNIALKQNDSLEPPTPAPLLSSTYKLDKHYQISIPELFEYFFTEDEAENDTCGTIYNSEDISEAPVLDCTFCTCKNEKSFSTLHDSQKPIPSFPCSRNLTFPKPNHLAPILNAHSEDGDISPVRVLPPSFTQAGDSKAGGSRTWQTLLSVKKICCHAKGSTWCRRSGAWVFPAHAEKASERRKDPPSAAIAEGRVHWRIWEMLHTRQEGILSTLKQSDMCLVCIAFASWVLKSSNPEAGDAWKAALLANVSALSAIQFLRQYVKRTPLQDDP